MAVLSDIWRTSIAENLTLRAGEKGLSHPVSWVYVCQENEIEPWIQGNEILILYGAGMKCDEQSLVKLVELCSKCRIAGVIALTGNFIKSIPEAMLQKADCLEMPIIEVPYTIPISRITKDIANMILSREHNAKNNIAAETLCTILERKGNAFGDYLRILEKNEYLWKRENLIFILEFEEAEAMGRVGTITEKIISLELGTNIFYGSSNCFIGLAGEEKELLNKVKESTARIIQQLNIKYRIDCHFSIGTVVEEIQALPESFEMAKKALTLRSLEKIKEKIVTINQFPVILQLLSINYDEKDLSQIVKENLGPLLSYDLHHGTELLETLKVFLNCSCNGKETAEKLYIHRNTMAYRIRQIEKITNKKLADMKVCYEYVTAYYCLEYLLLSGHKMEEINC